MRSLETQRIGQGSVASPHRAERRQPGDAGRLEAMTRPAEEIGAEAKRLAWRIEADCLSYTFSENERVRVEAECVSALTIARDAGRAEGIEQAAKVLVVGGFILASDFVRRALL